MANTNKNASPSVKDVHKPNAPKRPVKRTGWKETIGRL